MGVDGTAEVLSLLAGERWGVLATHAEGRLHTATVLFAVTPDIEFVFAIRPATLKAQLAYASPEVAFQVDNRAVTETDRTRFARAGFEGDLRRVERDDPAWSGYRDTYAARLPFGRELFDSPEVELHVLTTRTARFALGAGVAEDIAVPAPEPMPSEATGMANEPSTVTTVVETATVTETRPD